MSSTVNIPLTKNEHVKALLTVMAAQQSAGTKDLLAVVGQVTALENKLDEATKELVAMRQELASMRDEQRHPVRTALQNAVRATGAHITALGKRMTELKNSIITGCKNALAALRDKGISALDSVARFLHVKPALAALEQGLDKAIREDNKSIANIEAASVEYHKLGRQVDNIGRAMLGRELTEEVRPVGHVAHALEAPIKADRRCLVAMKRHTAKAIGSLDRLEKSVAEKKPSIRETMEQCQKQADAANKVRPEPAKKREPER